MKCLLFTTFIISTFFATGIAQTQSSISKEKQDLIQRFRQATGADRVNAGINVSLDDVKAELSEIVESDKELNNGQKQQLKVAAGEAYDRLDKQLKAFLNDGSSANALETVIVQLYDSNFSETELRDAIAFYSTPTGRKASDFLWGLNANVQKSFQSVLLPKIQEFITPKINLETEQLKQKILLTKGKKL